jgi:hypothetical protein
MDAKMVVSLTDVMGRPTSMRIELTGADEATIMAAGALVCSELDAASKLGVTKAVIQFPLSGVASAAAAGSNTDVGGKARGYSSTDGDTLILRLPDPIDACVNADGTIDLTNATLKLFIDEFLSGGVAMLSDGEQISSWRYATLDSR